jgi:Bacterial Ig-like domain/Fibronectin type III domain
MNAKQLCLGMLLVFLVACGGTSTPDPKPNPSDKTAPKLESSIPETSTSNVPINVKLAFSFNEAMDEGSLELSSTPALTLGTPTWTANGTGVAFENEALAASTPYTLTVKAKDVSGNALAATTLTFTTSDTADTTAPTTPTGLVATPANGQVTLTWQANPESDVAGYTVYVGTAENALEPTTFVTETTKTIPGLTNDTQYFFAVDAVDVAANKSSKTTPVSATPSATVTDTTPPKIQSGDPADNASNVTGEVVFSIVFSEPMDKSSLTFTLEPPDYVLEGITWSSNDTTLTLSPLQLHLFTEKTTYKLSLSAKDKAANALAGDTEINFTTAELAATLISSTPEVGASNVPLDLRKVLLTFSKAVDPATFTLETTFPNEGYDWLNDDTTLQIDVAALNDESTYNVSYTGKDKQGRAFTGSFSFSTIPDSGSPHVASTSPQDGATNVPLTMPTGGIGIYFDDVMDEASALAAVSSSLSLGCTWEFSDGLECLAPNLAEDTTYIITVSTAAKDTSGNPLSRKLCRGSFPCSYSFKFSTGNTIDETKPTINTELSEPDNGTKDVPLTSTINVIFSERMNELSVEQVFIASVDGNKIAGKFGWFKSGMVFFPDAALPACKDVNVVISTEATDLAENFLTSSYNITFKTVCN